MGLPALKEENLLSTVATSSAFLEIRGLTKSYGSGARATSVLRDINLTLAEGEFVAIVGFSGSRQERGRCKANARGVEAWKALGTDGARESAPRPVFMDGNDHG
jgi:hypothetical protein